MVRVLRGVRLRIDHDTFEEGTQVRFCPLRIGNGQADQCSGTGRDICKDVLRVQHDAGRVDHIILRRQKALRDPVENAQQPLTVHNAAEKLLHGHLGGNIVLNIPLLIHLRKQGSGESRYAVIGEHPQAQRVDGVPLFYLIDKIGICPLIFVRKIHDDPPQLSYSHRTRKLHAATLFTQAAPSGEKTPASKYFSSTTSSPSVLI